MTNEEQKTEQLQEEFAQKIKSAHQQETRGGLLAAKGLAKKKNSALVGKAALLLAGLIIGIFISGSLGVDFSNTSGGRVLGIQKFSSDNKVMEKNGQTWVAYDDPIIKTTVITDKDCEACDPTETIDMIRQSLLPTIKVTRIESGSEKAKQLIEKFKIKAIPAFIFGSELAKAKNFKKASSVFQENDGSYLLDSQKAGIKAGEYLEIPKISDADAQKGPSDAPVTIIEISDFQCPYCGKAKKTVDELLKLYPDKIKLVFKNFPLGFHKNAQKAAEAFECAGEQGKYWEMYDKLFGNQKNLEIADLKKYAKELDLQTSQFNECLDSGKYEEKIKNSIEETQEFGISGTPGFFINKQFVGGAQPLEAFKKVIDKELGK